MHKYLYSWIVCFFFLKVIVFAQCPAKYQVEKRMALFRGTSKISDTVKLAELQGYLSRIDACPYKYDSTHTSLLSLISGLYARDGNYIKSIQCRRKAIEIITAHPNNTSVKQNTLPMHYYWLSVAYDSLNNFSEKMKALDSCFSIAIRLNYVDRASLTAIFTYLLYYFDLGDYRRCIDYAIRCQALASQYKINNIPQEQLVSESYISSSFGWQVIALIKLKNFIEAETLLNNRVAELKKKGLTNYLGTTYSQLAEVQMSKGEFLKSQSFYEKALRADRNAGNVFNCKQTLKDIGYSIYFNHYNDNNSAMCQYKKALGLVNKDKSLTLEDAFESLDIYAKIANIYAWQGFYDSAFHYFQKAFDQIKPGIDETYILHSSPEEIQYKKIYYLTRLLLDKGLTLLKKYKNSRKNQDIKKAIAVFKATDQFLDRIRLEQKDPISKLSWRSDSRRLYEYAIEACHLAGKPEDAFYFFEKSKAALLADQLKEQHYEKQTDIRRQTQLKKNIMLLERELKKHDTPSEHNKTLQAELFAKKIELDKIRQAISTGNPLYYQSFLDTAFITLSDVRKNILNDHQAFIELFTGDSSVYTLIVTKQKTQLHKIDRSAFDTLSYSFLHYLSDPAYLNVNYEGFLKNSQQLYHLLFQHVSLPEGRIIISPDARYLPFEALVIGLRNQKPSYFLEKYAVSYTYSARYLTNQFTSYSITSAHSFMGMAPESYLPQMDLPALPGSSESLLRLKNRFSNVRLFIGKDASRNNFLEQFYRYRIIQLYTHATDSGYNGDPVIYFRDSALLLSDLVYENKTNTNLIVLSACQTGIGKLYQGEGVFSFNRGFAALGIPSTITNLWQVDNESIYELTELFYQWLGKGLPMDVALQKAKLDFINASTKEKKLPYYWAATVLTGKSNAIVTLKAATWKWLAGIVIISVLCIAGFSRWIKKYHLPVQQKFLKPLKLC
jgi:CHAT domain-containing protein